MQALVAAQLGYKREAQDDDGKQDREHEQLRRHGLRIVLFSGDARGRPKWSPSGC
jgi:hypothetical protein